MRKRTPPLTPEERRAQEEARRMASHNEQREKFAELARLRFDAELALRKCYVYAAENDLPFQFNAEEIRNARDDRYGDGWRSSSSYC